MIYKITVVIEENTLTFYSKAIILVDDGLYFVDGYDDLPKSITKTKNLQDLRIEVIL